MRRQRPQVASFGRQRRLKNRRLPSFPELVALCTQIQVLQIRIVVPDINDLFAFLGRTLRVGARNVVDPWQRGVEFRVLVDNQAELGVAVLHRCFHDGDDHILVDNRLDVFATAAKVLKCIRRPR